LPDVHVLQLDPVAAEPPLSPATRAVHTDIRRRGPRVPQSGHARFFPLSPILHRRSKTRPQLLHRNS